MDTRTATPVRPSRAERARTVLASAASASVHWDGGRVDLLGCHRDNALGDVVLTLDDTSSLVGAVRSSAHRGDGDLPAVIEFTELCPVNARHRVRSRLTLGGWLAVSPAVPSSTSYCQRHQDPPAVLSFDVAEATFEQDGDRSSVSLGDYRDAVPDPLHPVAAEQLQHLEAHHQDAISLLSRLCDRATLMGATRILPLALDRFGLMLRVEKLRGHTDVRLGFREPITTGAGAVAEMNHLFVEASRRRPCARPLTH